MATSLLFRFYNYTNKISKVKIIVRPVKENYMPKGFKHNMKVRKLNAELKNYYFENNIVPTHKWCCKCEQKLEVNKFIKAEKHIFGRCVKCRDCDAAYKKEYVDKNKDKVKIAQAKKFQNNKHKYKETNKPYIQAYKPIRNAKQKIRYDTDPNYKTRHNLRTSLTKFMNGTKKKKTNEYGISWDACIEHLGIAPSELTKSSIDHIIPCEAFDFTNSEHPKLCYYPKNLRWLEYEENCSKRHKIYPSLIRSHNLEWICKEIGLDLDTYSEGEYLRIDNCQ